ncbi:MAG: glycerol kinase GlpK, partial [Cyanobacteria bacterium J06639_1]
MAYILALDLGTTGNRAILFGDRGQIVEQVYKEFPQHYPQPGWVEHDAIDIWKDTLEVMRGVFQKSAIAPTDIAAIGLTVQRETCLLWDKTTGQPLHRAIVWQDRRTAAACDRLRAAGKAEDIERRTGLQLDAYFSATKLAWLIDRVKQDHPDLDWQNVLAGTIDTWMLWKLTGGAVHATDHSNASRTLLMNIDNADWDEALLDIFGIPAHIMPTIQPSIGEFGRLDPDICGADIPITAIFGDQQAALYAHGCDRPGLMKCTYGTGSFLVSNTGTEVKRSQNKLLSTVAWSQSANGNVDISYALEGSIFTTGASIQWLRDGLKAIETAAETAAISESVPDTDGALFVPALSGLGAPHWDMTARGAFFGLTRGTTRAHMVRAVLEAIAFQVTEIVTCINADLGTPIRRLKVDGGACQNDFLMQFQADV